MCKRMWRKVLSVFVSICFIMVQSMNVNAAGNNELSVEQFNTILNGMESIVSQLENWGLNDKEIDEWFMFAPRESSFYEVTQVNTVSYTGSFVMENVDQSTVYKGIAAYGSYDGNPPSSNEMQKQRIQNIYAVALQNFHSDYYQGSDKNGDDFGKYLTYLYLSHYIDGPGRAPVAGDLPYIISSADVQAYSQFISNAKLANWATQLANLGSAVYSDFDYFYNLNAINTIDRILFDATDDMAMAALNGYNTSGAIVSIVPLIKSSFDEYYYTASTDEELTQETFNYVSSQLYALDFYKDYDKNITDTITNLLITTFISVLCSSVSLIGLLVSVVPLYVYEVTGLIQAAVLVNLQYSFSGRHAVRTGIYLGL